jgi:hypothetical protein
MYAALAVNSKSLILFSIPILLILYGCAPNVAPLPTETRVQEAPTAVEPTVEAADSTPTEAPLKISLSAVKLAAIVFKGGNTETQVKQDQELDVETSDRIEVIKPEKPEEQSHSVLKFADFLEVELFSNAKVVLEEVREEAGGSTHVTLNLSRGHMFVTLRDQANSRVTVVTPDAIINTLEDGTVFYVCKTPDVLTCVKVQEGSVELIAQDEKRTVRPEEAMYVKADQPASEVVCAPNVIFTEWAERYRQFGTTPTLGRMVAEFEGLCGWQTLELPPIARTRYSDPFTSALSGWPQERTDSYFIGYTTPDYYHVQLRNPGQKVEVMAPNHAKYGDVNVDLKALTVTAKSGDFHYGLTFRRSAENYYAFAVSPSAKKWYVFKSSADGLQTLKEGTNDSIQDLETENALRVVAKGEVFTFYINGTLVYQMTDPDYVEGEVGLFAQTVDSPSALIYFDSIILWDTQPAPSPTQGSREICFNGRDDDGDGFADRDDPECDRVGVPPTAITPSYP